MRTKIFTQSILIIILIIISLFIFLKYFSKTNLKSEIENPVEEIPISGESLIVDLKYFSTDKKGNEYEIVAKRGNIDKKNPDIIYLENVKAIISLQKSTSILIKSKFAKYNTKNYNTLFNDSVSVNYDNHLLKSNFLDLSFEENLVSIYDNVRYLSGISSLNADKAEIDILNKKTKIFMDNPSEKVLINKFSENGNN
jgi:hypothetical protein